MNINNVSWWSGRVELQLLLDLRICKNFSMATQIGYLIEPHVFERLCFTLKSLKLLEDDCHVRVEDAIVIFLLTISHNTRNWMVAETFQHSDKTISRHFNHVLIALCRYSRHIIKPRRLDETPPEIWHHHLVWGKWSYACLLYFLLKFVMIFYYMLCFIEMCWSNWWYSCKCIGSG